MVATLVLLSATLFTPVITKTATAAAGINHKIDFQGKLVNPDGTNVTDGNYSIVFSLYTVASAGSTIWTETDTVALSNGIFQVALGANCSFNVAAACNNSTPVDFNQDSLYLGIKVGADAEMTPRIQFTAVPQAFNSEKLNGLSSSAFGQLAANQTWSGTNLFQPSASTAALQVANASNAVFTVDTSGNNIIIGKASAQNATLQFAQAGGAGIVGITAGSGTASYTLTLPTTAPSTGQCLQAGAITATLLTFGTCGAGTLTGASNGLSLSGSTVILGGNLTQASTTITAPAADGLTVSSDLSTGARSTATLSIIQNDNATNNSTGSLLSIGQNDTGSSGAAAVSIGQQAAASNLELYGAGNATKLYVYGNQVSTGYGIRISGTNLNAPAFTGTQLEISPQNTLTSGNLTDSGSFLTAIRANTVNNAGSTYTINGNLVSIQSNCTQTAGTCADSSVLLNVSQQYTNATGNAMAILNNGSGNALAITQNRTTAALAITNNASNGNGASISATNGGGVALNVQGGATGILLEMGSTSLTTGTGVDLRGDALTTGNSILIGGTNVGSLTNFSSSIVNISPIRTNTATTGTVTDSGNFLKVARANTQNGAGGTFAITGALATLSSNCTQTAGTCTDNSNILNLNQQYANASGAVLNVQNSGTGAGANFAQTTGTGIKLSNVSGTAISIGSLDTGSGIDFGSSASTISSGSLIRSLTAVGSSFTTGMTGNLIDIGVSRSQLAANTTNDTGSLLNLTRAASTQIAGANYTISGALANLQSTCTQVAGSCTDTSNILKLNQQYASASGTVLSIQNSGTGNFINMANGTGTVLAVAAGGATTITTTTNSSTAFLVQNASSVTVMGVDTTVNQSSNLVVNPDFENSTTGWAATGTGASIVRNGAPANVYRGFAALDVTLGTSGATGAQITSTGLSGSALTPGTYTLSFYARGGAALSGLAVSFTGGTITQGCTLNSTSVVTAGFTRYFCTFIFTTSNVTAVSITSTTLSQHMYLDDVQVVSGSSVLPQYAGSIALDGAIDDPVLFKNINDSTTAFQIQNSAGTSNLFVADTLNGQVNIGGNNNTPLIVSSSTTNNTISLVPGTGAIGNQAYFAANSRARFGYNGTGVVIDTNGANKSISLWTGPSGNDQQRLTIDTSGGVTINGFSTAGIVTNTAAGLLGTVTSVPIANGGTNATSFANTNGVTYYDGAKLTVTAAGTSGQCFVGNTGAAPGWGSCGSSTLQGAYTGSTGGTTPEIIADSTRTGIDIQDANTTLGAGTTLLAVRASATSTTLGTLEFGVTNNGNVTALGTYNTNTFTSSQLTFGAASTASVASAASQALTITANAASTWSTSSGALTLTSAAAATWSTATGNLTLSAAGTSILALQTGGAGSVTVGATNTTSVQIGQSSGATSNTIYGTTTFSQAAGKQVLLTATGVPSSDQMSITNAGQGITTGGVNNLSLNFVGGAAAVESGALRVDVAPGSTTGGTWNGARIVQNATGPATGVTTNGVKLEGPATTGGAGTYNAINIANIGTVASGGVVRGINITGTNSQAAGTVRGIQLNNLTAGTASEIGMDLGTGWDSLLTYNNGGTVLIDGTGHWNLGQVTGTLGIGNGGTNNTSFTQWGSLYYDGTKIASTAAGTTGQCLVAQTGAAPIWTGCPATETLQQGYNASTGGTTPEIIADSTRTGIDIQDANTTLGAGTTLLAVRGSATSTTLGVLEFGVTNNGNVTALGTLTLGTLGSTNTATYLCRNSTNILAACNTTGTGAAFVQGGNSFGAQAVLGTNDANSLAFETNNTTRFTIDTSGNGVLTGSLTAASALLQSGTDTATTLLDLNTGIHGGTQFVIGGTINNESTLTLSVYRAGVYTPRVVVNSAGDLTLQGSSGNTTIGNSSATTITAISGNTTTTFATGGVTIKTSTNSSIAFQVQNASSFNVLTANTSSLETYVGGSYGSILAAPASPGAAVGANSGGTLSGANSNYWYRISAVNATGESVASTIVSLAGSAFTPISAPATPTAATNATAGGPVCGTGCKYELTYKTANGETVVSGASTASITTSGFHVIVGNIPASWPTDVTQIVVYRSINGGAYFQINSGACSTIALGNTTCADSQVAQSAISPPASNTARTNSNTATITWSAVSGATSYRIYRCGPVILSSNGCWAYQTSASSPFTDTGGAGTTTDPLTNAAIGDFGVGTSAPSYNLDVQGQTGARIQTTRDTTTGFQVQNAAGATDFQIDTVNDSVMVSSTSSSAFLIQNAGGANTVQVANTGTGEGGVIANGGFENGTTTGWAPLAGVTLSLQTGGYTGAGHALRMQLTTPGTGTVGGTYALSGMFASVTYQFSFWSYMTNGDFSSSIPTVTFNNSAGACSPTAITNTNNTSMAKYACTFTTGATAPTSVQISGTETVSGGAIILDDTVLNACIFSCPDPDFIDSQGSIKFAAPITSPLFVTNGYLQGFTIKSSTDVTAPPVLMADTLDERVGIGTAAPAATLDVQFATTTGSDTGFSVTDNATPNATTLGYLNFGNGGGGSGSYFLRGDNGATQEFYLRADGGARLNNFLLVNQTNLYAGRLSVAESGSIVAAFERTDLTVSSGSGNIINFITGGTGAGTISVANGVVSYNGFVGSHYANVIGDAMHYGEVAINKGVSDHIGGTGSEPIYDIEASTSKNSPDVLGNFNSLQESGKPYSKDNHYLVMAAGNGASLIINEGGDSNITVGDNLITSDVAGYAMKDDASAPISHVFAKAAQNVDWSQITTTINGYKYTTISVLYGSYDKMNGLDQASFDTVQANNATLNVLTVNGALDAQSINTGDMQSATLEVAGNAAIGGDLSVAGGLTVSGLTTVADIVVNGHIITHGNAPQLSVGVAAGTSALDQAAPAATVDGTDTAGTVTISTGATVSDPGVLAEVTFANGYPDGTQYKVALTPTSDTALNIRVYVQKTANGFRIVAADKPAPGTSYSFDYIVIGSQQVASN